MNQSKFVKSFIFLTPIAVLPIVISLGALSASYLVLLSEPQQAFATVSGGGETVVQQGYATSSPDPLPGHEAHQSVTILKLRPDNAVYSGRITFTATQPVEVQILHRDMDGSGLLNIPENFGRFAVLDLPGGNGQVTITNVVPKFTEGATETGGTFAASVPFSGNAVALHNLNGDEFATTYTATADILGPAERLDDIQGPEASDTQDADTQDADTQDADTQDADTQDAEQQP